MQQGQVSIKKGKLEEAFAVAFAPVVALSELIKNASDSCTEKQDVIRIDIDTKLKIIRIKDNGYGFSLNDIESLRTIGHSDKMSGKNILSRIGEPYAGSKGLGILTAFNLCNMLEINTFSKEENKAYKVLWEKGTGTILYDESNEHQNIGTELVLNGVSDENIKLITMEDELTKLYLSSINYYVDSQTLPTIEIYLDGENKSYLPSQKLEVLYEKYKKKKGHKGQFSAKASFKYSKNKLTISYDENIKHLHDLKDEAIDLSDIKSINEFLKKNKFTLHKFREVYDEFNKYLETDLDDFEGVFYAWRGSRYNDMDYPYGIRIYANNYGLYNYLDKNNDWLQLSLISQNRKNTDYKLKNTFGYVAFKNYNEDLSGLKISNERNDFKVNLTQKKFMLLMQGFICNIFATIDINQRNYKEGIVFEEKASSKRAYENDEIGFKDLIKTNLTFAEIEIEVDNENITIDDVNGNIKVSKHGSYKLMFSHEGETIDIDLIVEEIIPSFELKKKTPKITHGSTYNLKDIINKSSCRHMSIEDINISSETAKIKKSTLSEENNPGDYLIRYAYTKSEPNVIQSLDLTINPTNAKEASKIKNLFLITNKYPKINDLIDGISGTYVTHPTLAMIAIRPLIEISLRIFIKEFYSQKEIENDLHDKRGFDAVGKINGLFKKLHKDELCQLNNSVLDKYKNKFLDKKIHNKVKTQYENLELNTIIHLENIHSTPKEVLQTMKIFQDLINFIIEAINAKTTPS